MSSICADLVGSAEYAQKIGLRYPDIDALEETNVADVLAAALADDRQHTQVVAIVENRRQVIGDGEIGAVQIARYDGDGIGVDPCADGVERFLARRRGFSAGRGRR